jgi:uncharacterized coiled-coil protein SlyX
LEENQLKISELQKRIDTFERDKASKQIVISELKQELTEMDIKLG